MRFCSSANFALQSSTNFKCVVLRDTVPTWSVRKYQHELKSWSLFNFAIYHTFCTVWNVQNYVIAPIKQTLQFHSNSFMFVSLVAINRADWSTRRSQHGHTSHVRLHLLAGIDDDDDQIQMQNTCWLLKTPALHQTFPPPLPPLGKSQATCSMFWKFQVGSSYLSGGPGGIIILEIHFETGFETFANDWQRNHHHFKAPASAIEAKS